MAQLVAGFVRDPEGHDDREHQRRREHLPRGLARPIRDERVHPQMTVVPAPGVGARRTRRCSAVTTTVGGRNGFGADGTPSTGTYVIVAVPDFSVRRSPRRSIRTVGAVSASHDLVTGGWDSCSASCSDALATSVGVSDGGSGTRPDGSLSSNHPNVRNVA